MLTEKEVRYVAELANLQLSDDEARRFQSELDGILEHMARLNEIDTSGVEPMAQVLYQTEPESTLRADTPIPPLSNPEAVANAPQTSSGYFKVPKVIDR